MVFVPNRQIDYFLRVNPFANLQHICALGFHQVRNLAPNIHLATVCRNLRPCFLQVEDLRWLPVQLRINFKSFYF